MALSNKERQERWLKTHRALHNFRRRKSKGGDATCPISENPVQVSNAELTVRPAGSATITKLLELVKKESERPVEASVAVPTVFRDDYGRVISEGQWKRLQELNQEAKDGGYERDEYSQ